MKRTADVIIGSLVATLASPVIAVLAITGALVWRTNPFFVQERVGLGGARYRVLKLRSLPPEAPVYADKYAIQDVRTPRFGQLLRRLHLDEVPQVFHVVSGKMSLVGPRPEMPFLHEQMPRDFADARVSVRPGLTGLWQVSPALTGLIAEAPEYDRAYLALANARLDAWIIWRTLLKVVGVPPATLADIPRWALPSSTDRFVPRDPQDARQAA